MNFFEGVISSGNTGQSQRISNIANTLQMKQSQKQPNYFESSQTACIDLKIKKDVYAAEVDAADVDAVDVDAADVDAADVDTADVDAANKFTL